jgi:hypothetical protein
MFAYESTLRQNLRKQHCHVLLLAHSQVPQISLLPTATVEGCLSESLKAEASKQRNCSKRFVHDHFFRSCHCTN